MATLPIRNLINEVMEEGEVISQFREYIGMSSLMGPCQRKIWYDFHWAYVRKIPKRVKRIFNRGHYEEASIVNDFKAAGIEVVCTGDNQQEMVDDTGHIKGHGDGVLNNVPGAEKTPHLFEGKTMKHSRFTKYMKVGLEKSDRVYWGQIHTYMGEMGLTRCVYGVVNKDTDERDFKRIEYDPAVHKQCMEIGFDILTSEFPPKKIGEKTWFDCKFCSARGICHKGEPIHKSCRSCKYANIEMKGLWSCGNEEYKRSREIEVDTVIIDKERQLVGCEEYELSEVFV